MLGLPTKTCSPKHGKSSYQKHTKPSYAMPVICLRLLKYIAAFCMLDCVWAATSPPALELVGGNASTTCDNPAIGVIGNVHKCPGMSSFGPAAFAWNTLFYSPAPSGNGSLLNLMQPNNVGATVPLRASSCVDNYVMAGSVDINLGEYCTLAAGNGYGCKRSWCWQARSSVACSGGRLASPVNVAGFNSDTSFYRSLDMCEGARYVKLRGGGYCGRNSFLDDVNTASDNLRISCTPPSPPPAPPPTLPPPPPLVLSPPPPPPLSCTGGWHGSSCAGDDEPEQKKFCNTEIYNNETGYCQCSNGQNVTFSCDIKGKGDTRPPFTCTQVCSTASPGLQPCTGTRRDCSRYVCNPNGKYEAYYDIPGRPDQGSKGNLVTKVEVIFDNDRYNNGPDQYSGANSYNPDFVTYAFISTGCTYGDGTFNEPVKYNTTTNKPINPPTCTPKNRTDGDFNSKGEPMKKQPVVYGQFNDNYYSVGNGALFIPVEASPNTVSKIFEFHWCPNQNTFQVMVFKTGPYQFVHVKPEDIVAGKQTEIDQLQADNTQCADDKRELEAALKCAGFENKIKNCNRKIKNKLWKCKKNKLWKKCKKTCCDAGFPPPPPSPSPSPSPPDPLTMWDSYPFGLILHGPGSYYRNDPSITVNEKHVTTLDAAIARVKEVCRESPDNPVILWQLAGSLWYHRQKFLTQNLDRSTGKPIDTGFARAISKNGVFYGSPMFFRRRVFFVTRHATTGTESPGETKRGYVWGQRFDSEDEAFAKFAEYDGGPYPTGVWNEQVTELKYYGTRGVAEELKEWVREEINA